MMMTRSASEQGIFEKLLGYRGQKIVVAKRSSGERLEGIVDYVMFDSLLLKDAGGRHVIAFSDILFLDEV